MTFRCDRTVAIVLKRGVKAALSAGCCFIQRKLKWARESAVNYFKMHGIWFEFRIMVVASFILFHSTKGNNDTITWDSEEVVCLASGKEYVAFRTAACTLHPVIVTCWLVMAGWVTELSVGDCVIV